MVPKNPATKNPATKHMLAKNVPEKNMPEKNRPEKNRATKKKSQEAKLNTYRAGPNEQGFFGLFGGRFVAETLMPLILELGRAYEDAKADPSFQGELDALNAHYAGRPSPLYCAARLTRHLGGAKVYFKRDELNHTGSHKINNCLGQILLAKRMGKTRLVEAAHCASTPLTSASLSAGRRRRCPYRRGRTCS